MRALSGILALSILVFPDGASAQPQNPVPQNRGLRPLDQPAPPAVITTGKAYALIIATDTYDDKVWPQLSNPVNDARAIAAELKTNYGYEEPDLLINATVEAVYARVDSYVRRKFGPADSLLIFIAGHGKFDETYNRGYLVFRNSKANDSANRSYMSHSDLSNAVDRVQCRRILLVIDACFGGTFDNQINSRGAPSLEYPEVSKAEIIARKTGLTTRIFLTSGGREYVPDGRPGAHSPFASGILLALRNYGAGSGMVTSMELFQQVDRLARKESPQYGWFGKADPGSDFWFAANHTAVPRTEATAVHSAEKTNPEPRREKPVNPVDGLAYVFIPPGAFRMGCSPGDTECTMRVLPPAPTELDLTLQATNEVVSQEKIASGFWLGQTEVTQEAWKKVNIGDNPSSVKGDRLPVENVDWNQASAYCKAVGGRLPTQREWEYAARAGTENSRYGRLDSIAWYSGNSGQTVHEAGLKEANAFGLYDMLGNVWEWTEDGLTNEIGAFRGGSAISDALSIRASRKGGSGHAYKNKDVGFRCVAESDLSFGVNRAEAAQAQAAATRAMEKTYVQPRPVPGSDAAHGAEKTKVQPPREKRVNPVDGLAYVFVPPGAFRMGCSAGDTECPLRAGGDQFMNEVVSEEQIASGFWLGQTEVTQEAWRKVITGDNPSGVKGDRLPVENVDWNQASAYCKVIGGRLPTQKEWEYAARGGTEGARYGALDSIAWFLGNSAHTLHEVGVKTPNAFGLYDMLGNVWEWTGDDLTVRFKGLRGGSAVSDAPEVRASYRNGAEPDYRRNDTGFRCVAEFR